MNMSSYFKTQISFSYTDLGPIQIGDRSHTCVIGKELYPPEGSECEKVN
jgi:hypothetical protein